jgi:rod shape determining protein RodA
MSNNKNFTSRIDYGLLFIVFLLFITSCMAIYSAQTTGQYAENFLVKQIVWYIVGISLAFVIMRFDADQMKKMSWYLYFFGLFLLMTIIIAPTSIAPVVNGAKSWFRFPGIGSIQPSEFMKVFLILALAALIQNHHLKHRIKTLQTDFILLCKIVLTTAIPILLVMKQPDLGTSLVMIAIMVGMIFVSGITWKLLLPIFGGGTLLVGVIFYLVVWHPNIMEKYFHVKQYQFGRIYAWLDPYNYTSSEGYQLIKSLLAIGSGTTSGKGFANREVYLPEGHTDFIFAVIGEEYGFLGSSIVISLFFLLIYNMTKIGLETKNDFNTYICVGVICMLTFHVFENIGMTIGLLPITGIPLPFLSYGGSSLLGNMMALGLIFSIRYHHKKYMFSTSS